MKICYGDANGKLQGLLNPIIPHGDINYALRYLLHLDIEGKKNYKVSDIVCVNCNDAEEHFARGALPWETGSTYIKLYNIAIKFGFTEKAALLTYLKSNEPGLFKYVNTSKGRSEINEVIRDAKSYSFKDKIDTDKSKKYLDLYNIAINNHIVTKAQMLIHLKSNNSTLYHFVSTKKGDAVLNDVILDARYLFAQNNDQNFFN